MLHGIPPKIDNGEYLSPWVTGIEEAFGRERAF
jgi:hypothetical protein